MKNVYFQGYPASTISRSVPVHLNSPPMRTERTPSSVGRRFEWVKLFNHSDLMALPNAILLCTLLAMCFWKYKIKLLLLSRGNHCKEPLPSFVAHCEFDARSVRCCWQMEATYMTSLLTPSIVLSSFRHPFSRRKFDASIRHPIQLSVTGWCHVAVVNCDAFKSQLMKKTFCEPCNI